MIFLKIIDCFFIVINKSKHALPTNRSNKYQIHTSLNVKLILMIYYIILLTTKNNEKEFIKQTLIKIEDSLHLGFVCPLLHP